MTLEQIPMDLSRLTSSVVGSPAKTSVLLDAVRDWQAAGAPCSFSSPESSALSSLAGALSRMSQDYFLSALAVDAIEPASFYAGITEEADGILKAALATAGDARQPAPSAQHTVERTLGSFSQPWLTSGFLSHGGYLTLKTGESHNAAVESTLSDILEAHVPPKYSLSPKACAGILRRAKLRKRKLPTHLAAALESVVGMTTLNGQEPSFPKKDDASRVVAAEGNDGALIPRPLFPSEPMHSPKIRDGTRAQTGAGTTSQNEPEPLWQAEQEHPGRAGQDLQKKTNTSSSTHVRRPSSASQALTPKDTATQLALQPSVLPTPTHQEAPTAGDGTVGLATKYPSSPSMLTKETPSMDPPTMPTDENGTNCNGQGQSIPTAGKVLEAEAVASWSVRRLTKTEPLEPKPNP